MSPGRTYHHGRITLPCAALVLILTAAAAHAADTPVTEDKLAGNACITCHRDLPGRSSEIVAEEWAHSVHYAAGVTCEGCHGGDPAVRREQFASEADFKRAAHLSRNPEFLTVHRSDREFVSTVRGRAVSYFCGKCHAQIKEKHLGSPHGDFGDPTCLYCHGQGSHKISDATSAIIDTRSRSEGGRCSQCHAGSTMEAVTRIKSTLEEAETAIAASGVRYAELESWGYRNLELEKLHHHAGEMNSRLRQIFHSFNMREINNFAAEIQGVAERTEATHEMVGRLREVQRGQTLVGLAAVTLLLCFAGTLVYYKRAFLEHAPGGAHARAEAARPGARELAEPADAAVLH